MSGHVEIQLALRTYLLTLSVCTTGTTSLSAVTGGYARASGSFLTDGFAVGMEVTPSGFADNSVGTITSVAALQLGINGGRTAEAAAGSRSLTVGLPAMRAWENLAFTPVAGIPYITESYDAGPSALTNDGFAGLMERRPMFYVQVSVPSNSGMTAARRYADALCNHFPPGTTFTASGAQSVVVRGDAAPYAGMQRQSADAAWSTVLVTIPLRATVLSTPS